MKILHTSDWHLGKTLNNITRYEEQQEFIDEIAEIAKRKMLILYLYPAIYTIHQILRQWQKICFLILP